MNWDVIKKGILKEISSAMTTLDPAIDLDSCITIYSKILKFKISVPTINNLDGLESSIYNTLNQNFVEGHINDSSVGLFCKNFEQFIKKIYYILEEGEFVSADNILDHTKLKALTPYLAALNKIKYIYLDSNNNEVYESELANIVDGKIQYKINDQNGGKAYKRLYPTSLSFDHYTNVDNVELNDRYKNNFLLYIIKAVILKNEQSHQIPERSRIANVTNFNTTLIAELYIINFLKKELINVLKKESYKNNDLDEYIRVEIDKMRKQSSRFVSLNLKELSKQNDKGRSGFIENLLMDDLSRMRILGQGGSGKTTTLEYLFFKDAEKWIDRVSHSKFPVFITLASLSSNERIIENIAKKLHVELDYIQELLETNEIKLYLDGINEIVENRESKKLKLQEIASLLENYPKLNLIITDRYEFDSYQSNMFDIPTFLIQKISKDQMEEFVFKYCNNLSDQSNHVLEILRSKQSIQEILLRPLVLTRAIEIIKIDNELPEKEGQIIEKFIDILLRREKDEKKDPLLNVTNFKLLLSYAATEIWSKHKTNASTHEFKFNKMLNEAAEKFGLEKSNAGYVSRIGYELEILSKNDDLIQFYHQSYIEFFCKHYISYEYR